MHTSLALLLPALALLAPPHGRVNHLCRVEWSADRRRAEVVMRDQRWVTPWVFDREVDANPQTCQSESCVQRLWCTDSGVVGRYVENARGGVRLDYVAFRDRGAGGSFDLSAVAGGIARDQLSPFGAASVTVVGDALFFLSHADDGAPFLSAVAFAVRNDTVHMVTRRYLFSGFDVLGFAGPAWDDVLTALYPVGDALTVSAHAPDCVVDTVVLPSAVPSRVLQVHAPAALFALGSLGRPFLTAPGHACRAAPTPLCHALGQGRFTWADAALTIAGVHFAPLAATPSFALPAALYVRDGVLASSLGPALVIRNGSLLAVESHATAACPAGELRAVSYTIGQSLAPRSSTPLGCRAEAALPPAARGEVPYAATLVRLLHDARGYALAAVTDLAAGTTATLGDERTFSGCRAGEYAAARCTPCPAGFFCPGPEYRSEERLPCPKGTTAPGEGLARCAVSAGFYFAYPGEARECEVGFFCPGGLAPRQQCPADRPLSIPGARSADQCFD